MEGISREGLHPNSGGEQTSFGSELGANDSVSFSDNLSTGGATSGTGSERTASTYTGGTGLKGRAAGIPAMLADGLQAGADALRQRRASTSTGSSVTALANDPAIAAVTDSLATGMQSSAEWLRDADMEKLKEGVEKQVKEHPARTLFVALGAGFLLGKVLRR
jgi:hypothetical protein